MQHHSQLNDEPLRAGKQLNFSPLADGRFAVSAVAIPAACLAAGLLDTVAALTMAAALYCGVSAVVLYFAAKSDELRSFGWANRVTWVRTTITVVLASLLVEADNADPAIWWWAGGLTALAWVLDGLDGKLARWQHRSSRFGATFDQEVDAALMLVLSLLLCFSGKIGYWIVIVGAMRYIFLASGYVWKAMAAQLPPSSLRRTVCAIQVLALLICLLPLTPPGLASYIGATALLVLAFSFGRDVLWLLRQPKPETHT